MVKNLNMRSLNRYLCLSVLILSVLIDASSYARTVTAPEFDMGPLTFRIGAVHLSDTATRIDAEIYQRPGWWVKADSNIHIVSAISSNTYPLRRIEGIPPGEEVYAGDSARIRATFVFDALAPEDSIINFRDADGHWDVMGINLNYRPKGLCTHICGTLHGQPSNSWAVIFPVAKDFRTNKKVIVPIDNGRFEYDMFTTDTLAYEIAVGMEMIGGNWTIHPFFCEGDTVSINLNVEDGKLYQRIKGGSLTGRMLSVYKDRDEILESSGVNEESRRLDSLRLYYTPEFYALRDQISKEKTGTAKRDSLFELYVAMERAGEHLAPAGKVAKSRSDSVIMLLNNVVTGFIETDGTLAGLESIFEKVYYNDEDLDQALDAFKRIYVPRYPNHPYTLQINRVLSNEKMERGSHYPDFSAPDLDGVVQRLSDLIAGKYAVIDLWASWCKPCRIHSMALIPLYEKWKDKGFTVVGIARESGDTDAMKRCIDHDGYPWLNLVELNDAGGIWSMYMAANSGGRTVFVSPSGNIIAIDPSADEVDEILKLVLKN